MKNARTLTETAFISKAVHENLSEFFHLSRQLYNAALEERIDCYKKTGRGLNKNDQCKSFTEIRKEFPEYEKFNGNYTEYLRSRTIRNFSKKETSATH